MNDNSKVGPLFRAVGNQSREKIPSKPDNRDRPRTGPAPVRDLSTPENREYWESIDKSLMDSLSKTPYPQNTLVYIISKDVEFKKRVIEVRQKRIIEDLKKIQDEAVELDRVLEQLGA